MAKKMKDRIAGFDCSLIEGRLRKDFGYEGKVDNLQREEDGIVVRLYNNEGFDVSIVRKEHFRWKSLVVQDYINSRSERQIKEMTDRSRGLSMVGYKVEDKYG